MSPPGWGWGGHSTSAGARDFSNHVVRLDQCGGGDWGVVLLRWGVCLIDAFCGVGLHHALIVLVEQLRRELRVRVAKVKDAVPFVEGLGVVEIAVAIAERVQETLAVLDIPGFFDHRALLSDLRRHPDARVESLPDGVDTIDIRMAAAEKS